MCGITNGVVFLTVLGYRHYNRRSTEQRAAQENALKSWQKKAQLPDWTIFYHSLPGNACNVSWFFFLRGTMEVETQIHGTLMYVHVFFKTAKAFGLPS
mgnify:CR=1 FL=1